MPLRTSIAGPVRRSRTAGLAAVTSLRRRHRRAVIPAGPGSPSTGQQAKSQLTWRQSPPSKSYAHAADRADPLLGVRLTLLAIAAPAATSRTSPFARDARQATRAGRTRRRPQLALADHPGLIPGIARILIRSCGTSPRHGPFTTRNRVGEAGPWWCSPIRVLTRSVLIKKRPHRMRGRQWPT